MNYVKKGFHQTLNCFNNMMSDTFGSLYNIYVYSSKQLHGAHWSVSEESETERAASVCMRVRL